MDKDQYRIGELAEKAGVTRRTIHYYMGRGLLPPPEGTGLGTTYSDEHLDRIRLIKKMQDAFLPLDIIKRRMASMTLEEIRAELDRNEVPAMIEKAIKHNIPAKKLGTSYDRVCLGFGLELHIPAGNPRAEELAASILKYVRKTMKEG